MPNGDDTQTVLKGVLIRGFMQAVVKYKEAEKYMNQVVTFKPGSRLGWNALVRLYEKMSTLKTDEPEIFYKLAKAYLNAGKIAQARQAVRNAEARGKPLPQAFIKRLEHAEMAHSPVSQPDAVGDSSKSQR